VTFHGALGGVQTPSISLITVTYNSSQQLRRFWQGLNFPSEIEWIVVDNNSTDGSADLAQSLGAKLVRADSNLGFSGGNNLGVRAASGNVLIFVNPDVKVDFAGLRRIACIVVARRVLAAPQLMNADGTPQENGRGAPFPNRKLSHMFRPNSTATSRYLVTVGPHDPPRPVVWAMGAVLGMSRETYDEIGGWESAYFIYYEDSDLCLRALHMGIPTEILGDVRLEHGWGRETAKGFRWNVWKHELRSALIFYSRHPYCVIPVGPSARRVREVERGG
jgi:N-acetylglucosaminyl-diphospho-decaprenol L-rhamnosyltransferase